MSQKKARLAAAKMIALASHKLENQELALMSETKYMHWLKYPTRDMLIRCHSVAREG